MFLTNYYLDFINVVNIVLGRGPRFRRAVAVQRVHAIRRTKEKQSQLRFLYFPSSEEYRQRGSEGVKKEKTCSLPVGTLGRHANGLPARVGRLEEVAQLLLEYVQPLRAGRVGHAQDRAPEVESVGHVGADAHEDEEDEVEGVAEDCDCCVSVSK